MDIGESPLEAREQDRPIVLVMWEVSVEGCNPRPDLAKSVRNSLKRIKLKRGRGVAPVI
jgi:hypothetical protein